MAETWITERSAVLPISRVGGRAAGRLVVGIAWSSQGIGGADCYMYNCIDSIIGLGFQDKKWTALEN